MKHGKRGQAKKPSPKRSLNLPDLDQAKSAAINSLLKLPLREGQPAPHALEHLANLVRVSSVSSRNRCRFDSAAGN